METFNSLIENIIKYEVENTSVDAINLQWFLNSRYSNFFWSVNKPRKGSLEITAKTDFKSSDFSYTIGIVD